MTQNRRRWWGRIAGAAAGAGAAIAGGAGAGTNYIHDPLLGVPVAGAGAVVGLAAGMRWDRRQHRLARARQWDAAFAYGPGPGPGGQGSPDSAWYWLAPWVAAVPFASQRQRYVAAVRRWCADAQPGRVWLVSGGPGSGKTRLAIQVSQALHGASPRWAVGWVRPGYGRQAIEIATDWDRPVLAVVDDADTREDLADLLTGLHRTPTTHPVRLLLLAREFSDWWTLLRRPHCSPGLPRHRADHPRRGVAPVEPV